MFLIFFFFFFFFFFIVKSAPFWLHFKDSCQGNIYQTVFKCSSLGRVNWLGDQIDSKWEPTPPTPYICHSFTDYWWIWYIALCALLYLVMLSPMPSPYLYTPSIHWTNYMYIKLVYIYVHLERRTLNYSELYMNFVKPQGPYMSEDDWCLMCEVQANILCGKALEIHRPCCSYTDLVYKYFNSTFGSSVKYGGVKSFYNVIPVNISQEYCTLCTEKEIDVNMLGKCCMTYVKQRFLDGKMFGTNSTI